MNIVYRTSHQPDKGGKNQLLRSDFFRFLLLFLCFLPSITTSYADEVYLLRGQLCSLWATAAGERINVSSSSGDNMLDKQLALEANRLSRIFEIRPGLKIVTAPNNISSNALATTDTLVAGTRGTVLLGRSMVFTELRENRRGWGGLAVAGFMAHEFAHIYQFSSNFYQMLKQGRSTVEASELHADFLAGYHLGLKRRAGQKMDIGAFMDGIYLYGDYAKQSQQHHGTPPKRRRAVREGYRTGIEGQRPIATIARIGVQKIEQIMDSSL